MRGRTCGAVAGLACLAALAAGATESGFRLYNVVPMYLGHEAEQAAKSVEMYERTGEDLALYSLTLHPSVPPTVFYAYADMGVEIAVATSDIFAGEKYDRLIWYCNQLHIPYFYHYMPEEFTNDALAKRKVVAFYTHPNQLLFKDFWDGINYAGANLCEWRKWKPSRPLEPAKTEAMKEEWRTLVKRIKADARLGPADFLVAALKVLAEGADEVEIGPRDQLGPVGKHLPALPTLKLSVERWPIYPMDFKDRYVSNGFACSSGPCGTRTERYLV